jgi:hypothetical protein
LTNRVFQFVFIPCEIQEAEGIYGVPAAPSTIAMFALAIFPKPIVTVNFSW